MSQHAARRSRHLDPHREPVLEEVATFPATLELATLATIWVCCRRSAGVIAATKPGVSSTKPPADCLMGYSCRVLLGLMGFCCSTQLGWVGGPDVLMRAIRCRSISSLPIHRHDLLDTALNNRWDMFANAFSPSSCPPKFWLISQWLISAEDPQLHDERTWPGIHHHRPRQRHARARVIWCMRLKNVMVPLSP